MVKNNFFQPQICGCFFIKISETPLTKLKKYDIIIKLTDADMAELADAHGSGPCERKFMQVQVLLSAP